MGRLRSQRSRAALAAVSAKLGCRQAFRFDVVGRFAVMPALVTFLLLSVVAGCASTSPDPSPVPRVTIRNDSGQPVDIVAFSHRNGTLSKQTTLGNGGTFGSEPAGAQCDDEYSYFVEAAGRRVATLNRPGCIGGTLVITPEMLHTPN